MGTPSLIRVILGFVVAAALSVSAAARDYERVLGLMAEVARELPGISAVEIDVAENALIVTTSAGQSATVFPDNLARVLDQIADPAEQRTEIARYLKLFIEATRTPPDTVSLAGILPVIRPAGWMGIPLASHPFLDDLVVYYVIDSAETVAYVTPEKLALLGVTTEQLDATARGNLHRLAETAETSVISRDPFVLVIGLGGFYEGSLLLEDAFWQALVAEHGPLAVALPARDMLAVVEAESPSAVDMLRARASGLNFASPYPITRCLLRRDADGWSWLDACP